MRYVKLECPGCGAVLEIDQSREYCFCEYCGTKVIQDKIVVEHKGIVTVSGIADEISLLERAFLFIEDGKWVEAEKYLEKALDANPKCAKAYIGKLLCQFKYRKITDLQKATKSLLIHDNYQKALRFATGDELIQYESLNEAVEKRDNAKESELINALLKSKGIYNNSKSFIDENTSKYNKASFTIVFWISALILFPLLLLVSIVFPVFLIFFALCLIYVIVAKGKFKSAIHVIKDYRKVIKRIDSEHKNYLKDKAAYDEYIKIRF